MTFEQRSEGRMEFVSTRWGGETVPSTKTASQAKALLGQSSECLRNRNGQGNCRMKSEGHDRMWDQGRAEGTRCVASQDFSFYEVSWENPGGF